MLTSLGLPSTDVAVAALSGNLFTVSLLGLAGVDLGTLSGSKVSSSGTITVSSENGLGKVALTTSATLDGAGTVGQVTTTTATVSPGNNWGPNNTGILNANGGVTWNSSTTFNVNLNDGSNTMPAFAQSAPVLAAGGSLAVNTPYYYLITANNAAGQQISTSNGLSISPIAGYQTIDLSWAPWAG